MVLILQAYALAIFFSQLSDAGRLLPGELPLSWCVELTLLCSAVWLIGSPGRVWLLRCTLVLLLLSFVLSAPDTPNHRLVLFFFSLLLLCEVWRNPTTLSGRFSVSEEFVHACRILTGVVYASAVVHKTNSDFFNPDLSCAAQFFRELVPYFSASRFVLQLVAWSTYLLELTLAIALLLNRCKIWVLLLGFVFHFILSLHHEMQFYNFSAVMYLLLLTQCSWSEAASSKVAAIVVRLGKIARLLCLLLILALLYFGVAPSLPFVSQGMVVLFWSMWALSIVALVVRHCSACVRASRGLGIAQYALFLVLLLLATGPYTGLRTRAALSMYSNLLITESSSNHVLIPRSLDLLGLLSDRAIILSSDSLGATPGIEVPMISLLHEVQQHKLAPFSFEYRRQVYEYPESMPAVSFPVWLKKIAIFRSVGDSTRGQCIW